MDVFISLPQITYEKVGLFGQVPFVAATKWRNLLSYRFTFHYDMSSTYIDRTFYMIR